MWIDGLMNHTTGTGFRVAILRRASIGNKSRVFSAERRGKTQVNEDSITSKVFGTMEIVGDRLLAPFLQYFLPDLKDRELTGLRVDFWRTFKSRESLATEKPYRSPDTVVEDGTGAIITFIESKWNRSLEPGQITDEYRLCDEYSKHDPHLLVVTKTFPEEIPEGVDKGAIDAGRFVFTTWKAINGWLKNRHHDSDLGRTDERLVAEVIGLLDDLRQRECIGLKPEELEGLTTAWELTNGFLQEVMLFMADLRGDLGPEGIVPLKQEGGQELYRDATSRSTGRRDWISSYFLFPFADRSWYQSRFFSFNKSSFLYVVFFLDRDEIQVGYWGNRGEMAQKVVSRELPGVEPPQLVPPYPGGSDWMSLDCKASSVSLDANSIDSLVEEGSNFDLFYTISLGEFRRGNEVALRENVTRRLGDLRSIVEQLGLREV